MDANLVLRLNEVRLMNLDGVMTIGLWSDLDGPHIRSALRHLHPDGMPPIRYIDGPHIPMRYKARRSKGEPVPLDIVRAMQAVVTGEPWIVRDWMLKDIEWRPYLYVYGDDS